MPSPSSRSNSIYLLQARELVANGMPVAVVTVVRGNNPGAKLLVTSTDAEGTLGSSELDELTIVEARIALTTGSSGVVNLIPEVDAFIDVFSPPPLLILIGAVHVAQAVVTYAQPLGFRIVVVDAREALATRDRFPTVDDLLVAWPNEAYSRLPIASTSAIVILTHDPKFDEPAILGALETDAGYIGAVGSRKTNEERRDRLLATGAKPEQLDRVHGPIGLNIGGKSPEEMAISILAEVIAVRNNRSGESLRASSGRIRA